MSKKTLAASELILTAHQTIYHLDIAPHQLAPTIITVGDPDRVPEVSKHFDTITHQGRHREFAAHTGMLSGKSITVVSTGIGPDNIDIVLNELDALANIDFATRTIKDHPSRLTIIRLGTCGGLQEDVPVDSLIVSSHGIGMDNLLHYYHNSHTDEENALLAAFTHHIRPGSNIVPYMAPASPLSGHFRDGFTQGITVTCPGFYAPQGRSLRLPPAFPYLPELLASFSYNGLRITNFEMETAAIYGLGRLMGHECLSISTVVANRVAKTFSKNPAAAVENMIKRSLEVIVALPE